MLVIDIVCFAYHSDLPVLISLLDPIFIGEGNEGAVWWSPAVRQCKTTITYQGDCFSIGLNAVVVKQMHSGIESGVFQISV